MAMSAIEGLPRNLLGVGHVGKRNVGEGMADCVDPADLLRAQQWSVQEDVVVVAGGRDTDEAEQWMQRSDAVPTPQK
jgi:hypothetical protein